MQRFKVSHFDVSSAFGWSRFHLAVHVVAAVQGENVFAETPRKRNERIFSFFGLPIQRDASKMLSTGQQFYFYLLKILRSNKTTPTLVDFQFLLFSRER